MTLKEKLLATYGTNTNVAAQPRIITETLPKHPTHYKKRNQTGKKDARDYPRGEDPFGALENARDYRSERTLKTRTGSDSRLGLHREATGDDENQEPVIDDAFIRREFALGVEAEMRHGTDKEAAVQLVKVNLKKNPRHYFDPRRTNEQTTTGNVVSWQARNWVDPDPKRKRINRIARRSMGLSEEDGDSRTHLNRHPTSGEDGEAEAMGSEHVPYTADQFQAGLDYELSKMVKPDRSAAIDIVVANLRTNPRFYTDLVMLGIEEQKKKKKMAIEAILAGWRNKKQDDVAYYTERNFRECSKHKLI